MKSCLLMRHGATDMVGTFCGHSDPPLNELGLLQITRAASALPVAPDAVYSSDLLRARESADILSARFRVPVTIRPNLREIDFGQWEGLPWQQIEQRFPAESDLWLAQFPAGTIPSGEPYAAFVARVDSELAFLASQSASRNIVAVTHGGVIRRALARRCGAPNEQAFALPLEYGAVVDLGVMAFTPRKSAPGTRSADTPSASR